jgi:hypothetical protein
MYYLLFLHGSDGLANALQSCDTRTLPFLLFITLAMHKETTVL